MSTSPKRPPKRVRRSAADARSLILDAAEKRLQEAGPSGLRLQEVAADAGVSHPNILHHFGSREGLVEAVVNRALETLQRDVLGALASESFEAPDAAALLTRVATILRDRGHARLLGWLALEGSTATDPTHMIRALADVMHARREAERGGRASKEDTVFLVMLTTLALLGEAIFADGLWESAGLGGDHAAPGRFKAWLVELLRTHMHAPPPDPARGPRGTRAR